MSWVGAVGVAAGVVNPLDNPWVVGVAAAVGSGACTAEGAVLAVDGVLCTPETTPEVPGAVEWVVGVDRCDGVELKVLGVVVCNPVEGVVVPDVPVPGVLVPGVVMDPCVEPVTGAFPTVPVVAVVPRSGCGAPPNSPPRNPDEPCVAPWSVVELWPVTP